MTVHARPPHTDYKDAREFEQQVADVLEKQTHGIVTRFDSVNELDIWVPGLFLDVKEKRQRYGKRFTDLWPDLDERNMFILDELSVRKAMVKDPRSAYFLLRDVPGGDRLFIVSALEVASGERVRVDRETSPGRRKGKWLIDLGGCRRLPALDQLFEFVMADMASMPWGQSECLSHIYEVPTS